MICRSCGSFIERKYDCVAEKAEFGELHGGYCWRGVAPDEAQREQLVDALVRSAEKRAIQLRFDVE